MKKRILISIILALFILPLTSCEKVSSLVPKALASDTQSVVEQVEADTDDVFAEIQHNIDLVTNLKNKVQQAQIDNKSITIDDIIDDLQTVTQSYEKLSGQHQGIKSGLLKKIANIEDMQEKVNEEVNSLHQKRANYASQLAAVNDTNPEIVKARQEALTQAIKYVSAQIDLWVAFSQIEGDISGEMANLEKTINEFLNMVDSSAIVFREGLNLLLLQKNIDDALSLFTQDLPEMQSLTLQMNLSWATLDYLVETLTSISTVGITSQPAGK